jgi:hypothetical protein
MKPSGRLIRLGLGGVLVAGAFAPSLGSGVVASSSGSSGAFKAPGFQCNNNTSFHCEEVWDSEAVFGEGHYVGHDEPSLLYYSSQPHSGNQMQWQAQLPTDPSPSNPTQTNKSYTFELTPAFWFGMAMCDTQSAPNPVNNHSCTPDSDSNITTDANIGHHAGTAYMEMQFYPPGWVQEFNGPSCSATQWCAALNIDSLSEDYPNGEVQNATCQSETLGGLEYINYAYITKNGVPQGPPNPLQFNATSATPDPSKDLMMNPGDKIRVTMHDTVHGLRIDISDDTTGQTGFMVASAANGFGQMQFDPTGSSCNMIPYDFHPMYDTSSPQTRVPWAAHSYNIAYDPETGHFDQCHGSINAQGSCQGSESGGRPADSDDNACFPASASTLVQIEGCEDANYGFDGMSYIRDWPDGNPLHPTPIFVKDPLIATSSSNRSYTTQYQQVAFEADTPRIEAVTGQCNRTTGQGCTYVPEADTGSPAVFYPFFNANQTSSSCQWFAGNYYPGRTTNDWGGDSQYGSLLKLTYPALNTTNPGTPDYSTTTRYNDFRQILSDVPC